MTTPVTSKKKVFEQFAVEIRKHTCTKHTADTRCNVIRFINNNPMIINTTNARGVDKTGRSALVTAATYGDLLTCKLLIEKHKVNVNDRDTDGETALGAAFFNGINAQFSKVKEKYGKLINYLLNKGANREDAELEGIIIPAEIQQAIAIAKIKKTEEKKTKS